MDFSKLNHKSFNFMSNKDTSVKDFERSVVIETKE